MKIETFKETGVPDKPGVYFFLGPSKRSGVGLKGREILYIGKATSLKDRVKSYFGKDLIGTRGPIILDMVFKADKIDWQETDSVLEALILEANLIKKHQPKYNTKEKSDKSFNYVCITKDKLPKVIIVRGKNVKQVLFSKIYGPYPNGSQLKEALKIIRPIFPFLDDKSKNHYKFYKQVELVPDILSEEGIKRYKKNIANLKLFFEGKKKMVLKNIEKDMGAYAKRHEFENAGETKRQIFALKHINDIALIKNSPHPNPLLVKERGNFRIEAYDVAHMGGKNMVGVMVVVEDGEVAKNEYRKFKIRTQSDANDTGALSEMLERRLAHAGWQMPDLIVVDGSTSQVNAAKKILTRLNLVIPIVAVVKDEHHKARAIMGDEGLVKKFKKDILLANSESHRFAIAYHKNMRNKNFLK
jgi:excinuclease ABC subunit C